MKFAAALAIAFSLLIVIEILIRSQVVLGNLFTFGLPIGLVAGVWGILGVRIIFFILWIFGGLDLPSIPHDISERIRSQPSIVSDAQRTTVSFLNTISERVRFQPLIQADLQGSEVSDAPRVGISDRTRLQPLIQPESRPPVVSDSPRVAVSNPSHSPRSLLGSHPTRNIILIGLFGVAVVWAVRASVACVNFYSRHLG